MEEIETEGFTGKEKRREKFLHFEKQKRHTLDEDIEGQGVWVMGKLLINSI